MFNVIIGNIDINQTASLVIKPEQKSCKENRQYWIVDLFLTNGFAHHYQLGESTFVLGLIGVILNCHINV